MKCNKEMCLACKYHGTLGTVNGKRSEIACFYIDATGKAASLYDRRGSDPNHCNLFEKGTPKWQKIKSPKWCSWKEG